MKKYKKPVYLINKTTEAVLFIKSLNKTKSYKKMFNYFFILFILMNIFSLFKFNFYMLSINLVIFSILYVSSFILDRNITYEIVNSKSNEDSLFFIKNKKMLLISSAALLLLYFNFLIANNIFMVIFSFLIFIIIIYYLIQNSNIINYNKPILKINKYGIISSDYSYYFNLKKTNHKKTRYIFIPWQSIQNIDFLKRGGKKLIIKTEYAYWSYNSIENDVFTNNSKGQWHTVPEKIDIIVNIDMMNSLKFLKIEEMLEKYRSINIMVKPSFELIYEKETFKQINEIKKIKLSN